MLILLLPIGDPSLTWMRNIEAEREYLLPAAQHATGDQQKEFRVIALSALRTSARANLHAGNQNRIGQTSQNAIKTNTVLQSLLVWSSNPPMIIGLIASPSKWFAITDNASASGATW
mmetsp:Transcript_2092/g.4786  ORF Transcript_2092/g.4786 Transcript_2092/m.4786 type:complete len:117 (+) Transcript_2092:209-559(+)